MSDNKPFKVRITAIFNAKECSDKLRYKLSGFAKNDDRVDVRILKSDCIVVEEEKCNCTAPIVRGIPPDEYCANCDLPFEEAKEMDAEKFFNNKSMYNYVSGIENKKNVQNLMEEFAQLVLSDQQKEMEELKEQVKRRDKLLIISDYQIEQLKSRLTAYEQREKVVSDEEIVKQAFNRHPHHGEDTTSLTHKRYLDFIETAKWMRDQMNAGDGEKVAAEMQKRINDLEGFNSNQAQIIRSQRKCIEKITDAIKDVNH